MSEVLNVAKVKAKRTRKKSRLPLIIGGTITGVMILIGIISVFWIPMDVNVSDPSIRMLPIGTAHHLFGTDYLGRDVSSMLMTGIRTSIIIGSCAAFLALFIVLPLNNPSRNTVRFKTFTGVPSCIRVTVMGVSPVTVVVMMAIRSAFVKFCDKVAVIVPFPLPVGFTLHQD